MKEGWSYKRFKDICYSISDGDWIEKKDQSNSGIRLIQTGNIGVGKFIPKDDSRKFISEETFNRLKCCEIYEGDILISRLPNPLGRSCILPQLNTRCITAVDCSILKIKHEIVLPHYFMYYTQSKGYFSKIESESSGTTRARITRKKIEETIIPVPPLSEQRSIVTRLDAAFSHIDALKANAEKQLNEARKLFQAELTECMKPKERWEEKKLGEVARVQNGFAFDSKLFNENATGTPLIRIRDIKRAYTMTYTTETCSSDYIIENGHVLIGMDGDFNVCVWKGGHAYLNQRVCRVVPSDAILPRFIYYFLPFPLKRINDKTAFSTVKHLSSKQVNEILVPVPPLSVQQAIVSHLDSLSSHIRKLEELQQKTLTECDALKQAMLREVFE